MKPILEKLWNGRIAPAESCGEYDPEIKELAVLIEQNRDCLEKALGEQQKAILEKYIGCCEEYSYLITARAFCEGFSLASKLLMQALS